MQKKLIMEKDFPRMAATKKYLYNYSAYTACGKLISRQIRAQNMQWARHQIRKQGLQLFSIKRALQPPFGHRQNLSYSRDLSVV